MEEGLPTKSIEEIIKSKQMIGEHSPRARVEIEGLGGISWDNEIKWYTDRVIRSGERDVWRGGNFVTRADGKILATYNNVETGDIFLSTVEDEATIFTTNNILEGNEWIFTTITARDGVQPYNMQRSSLQKLSNGDILLYILDPEEVGKPLNIKLYKSTNGLGTDFSYISTIYESNIKNNARLTHIGQAIELDTGRILLPFNGTYKGRYDWDLGVGSYITYSDDGGMTWTVAQLYTSKRTDDTSCRGIANFNGTLVTKVSDYNAGGKTWFYYSNDNGETWESLPLYQNEFINGIKDTLFWDGVDTNYWGVYGGRELYALPDNIDLRIDESAYSKNGDYWQLTDVPGVGNLNLRTIFATDEGRLAWMGYSGRRGINLLGGTREAIEPKPTTIPIQSIDISKAKGMIGSSRIVIENKGGIYAPDGTDFPRVLIPNKEVRIYQGYGDNIHQTFTGIIDQVNMSSFPQLLTITSRDMLKLAKDKTITYQGYNTIEFTDNTLGQIFHRLASMAGLKVGIVEEADLAIKNKRFTWESYLDAFSWLEELIGFHLYCDNEGEINFVRDGQPDNVEVKYSFREGEDITSLSYTIDDDELYHDVVVIGEDDNEEPIRVDVRNPLAEYWNIPKDKILKIDAYDINTEDKLRRIARDAIYMMRVKARTVVFDCIAVPDLDIGDFISVHEQSSTIEEVYRITDMSSNQTGDRYTMTLTCYHHGQMEEDMRGDVYESIEEPKEEEGRRIPKESK